MASSTRAVGTNGVRTGPGPAQNFAPRSASALNEAGTQRFARRNRSRVAVGAFVMVACALVAAVLFSSAGDRHPVLSVARHVNAGEVIKSEDLTQVLISVDGSVETVPASARASLVGQVATVDLLPGSLLARGQVDQRSPGTADKAIVGAALKEGQFPIGLRQGDRVLVIVVPADNPDPNARTTQPPPAVSAVVVAVIPSSTQGGVTVSLAVQPSDAAAVATASSHGRLSVAVAPA